MVTVFLTVLVKSLVTVRKERKSVTESKDSAGAGAKMTQKTRKQRGKRR